MEGKFTITPYPELGGDEMAERVSQLEAQAKRDKETRRKVKHIEEQSEQIVNAVKELKEQQMEELIKLQGVEETLNKTTAQQMDKLV